MKICPKCKTRPSLRNTKSSFAPYCFECSSEYSKNRRVERKNLLKKVKSQPCADCGISYPDYVMDLDHRSDKVRDVSKMLSYSMDRLLSEISKCDIVCANCHRERTYKQQQH